MLAVAVSIPQMLLQIRFPGNPSKKKLNASNVFVIKSQKRVKK